jgi:hypothetical protein
LEAEKRVLERETQRGWSGLFFLFLTWLFLFLFLSLSSYLSSVVGVVVGELDGVVSLSRFFLSLESMEILFSALLARDVEHK